MVRQFSKDGMTVRVEVIGEIKNRLTAPEVEFFSELVLNYANSERHIVRPLAGQGLMEIYKALKPTECSYGGY